MLGRASMKKLFVFFCALVSQGCLLGNGACDDDHGPGGVRSGARGDCAGDTSQYVCIGGEGHYHWAEQDCPAETSCRTIDGVDGCYGGDEGASCATQQGCLAWLDCIDGVCVAATDAQLAACADAPTVTLQQDTWIDVEVTIAPGVMDDRLDPAGCAPGGGEGIVHLAYPPTEELFRDVDVKLAAPSMLGNVAVHQYFECARAPIGSVCLSSDAEAALDLEPLTLVVRTALLPPEATPLVLSIRQR